MSISLDQQSKVLYSLILLYVQAEGFRNILKLRCISLAFTSNKEFCIIFKYFSRYILLHDQISLSQCFYLLRSWAIFPLLLIVSRVLTSWILKLTLAFLSSHFPTWPKNSGQKFKYIQNEIRFKDEIKSIFPHF